MQWEKIDIGEAEFNEVTSRQGALTCFCADKKGDDVFVVKGRDGQDL